MKPEDKNLSPLLDELLTPGAAAGGPNCDEVLGLVRAERSRRAQRRMITVSALVILGAVTFSFIQRDQPDKPVEMAMPVSKPAVSPVSVPPVKQLSDDELLVILKDVPSALVEWPNGERTLLIVEHRAGE